MSRPHLSSGALLPTATPAAWLGVMGGGQLGRMFAHAAQSMGYKVAVLEPETDCPAGQVADLHVEAGYNDPLALQKLADLCVAVTTEFENVAAPSLASLAQHSFVAPNAAAVAIAQDRIAEKAFFTGCHAASGVAPAPHHIIASPADIDALPAQLLPGILKTVRMGYDGKGQVRVRTLAEVRSAFADMQQDYPDMRCVLEKMLPLAYEVSVLVARGADGEAAVYPIAENVHRDGILFSTTVPASSMGPELAAKAQHAALAISAALSYVGVLCIEFFVLENGELVVNEMAPRPHNSGHYTMDACFASQFEQQVRAMARLPLGDTHQHSPAVMLNLLGDLWFEAGSDASDTPREPAWDRILALPGAHLHLYGKSQARPGRKMGHITFVAPTPVQARAHFEAACAILGLEG
ncbi:5-(carboxyamino)imidazole ribonucleotide synthase [Herbaspirillum sp. RTI4]|uniref:5-(carboxyamino)imidazole ribonucleotide synthase n=1 Tax=Herbaspirillum sp. RTI4 TaxID=3048640 RepID=UPI002AB56447|nr:5-(carboxyamino)imidazole ribonucleotide synthase [Herbaspirillum sp. RTI4]MDY7576793.1 5-(carboxyamino)imidazole ribonucleotide synthase [Herbaspirillum sp. RTI4]MEA9981389.1 5-(carboxyamino)imidazole ribonucleotide synthase [Herbaspirillum sp. RTI4]